LKQTNNLKLISLEEIAAMINTSNKISTKEWLKKNNIQLEKYGKSCFAMKAEVECELLKPYVNNLKKKYPYSWVELLKKIASDDIVFEMLLDKLSSEKKTLLPTTKITIKSKNDKKLYNTLINRNDND
jgi:hypothetical protein